MDIFYFKKCPERKIAAWWLPVLGGLALLGSSLAADLPGSQDPPVMRRFEGSEIIGYHAPKFNELVLPISTPTGTPGRKSNDEWAVDGLVSRHLYLAPMGRSAIEVFRNYKLEFQRLGLKTLYEKGSGGYESFYPVFGTFSKEDTAESVFVGANKEERLLVGKSADVQPMYYAVYVVPDDIYRHPGERIQTGQVLVYVIAVAPEKMDEKMVRVNAEDMSRSLQESGKIALYGIYFDTDKDSLRDDSKPTLAEIVKLLNANPKLKLHVVGHTDNQGALAYNVDLSNRRAKAVVNALTHTFHVALDRLDAFGCGLYSPIASNAAESGRAKNRRVELVSW